MYQVTKTYGHNEGWACVFRQWRAESHCRFLHGYALAFELTFECTTLDERGWVVDFGALKPVKQMLQEIFDHKTLVADDDPRLADYLYMQGAGLMHLSRVEATGCEAFASIVYAAVQDQLRMLGLTPRVWLRSVRVSEHAGNSAIYIADRRR